MRPPLLRTRSGHFVGNFYLAEMNPPRSLKARALQLLAQREQSRVELRRKLLAHLKADEAKAAAARAALGRASEDGGNSDGRGRNGSGSSSNRSGSKGSGSDGRSGSNGSNGSNGSTIARDGDHFSESDALLAPVAADCFVEPSDAASRVEAVLEWLDAHQFASDERFAESRVNARSARYGNLRIRHELKQHAVAMTPETARTLAESEEARAAAVCGRRFGGPPETASERAKRARFLTARGFSPEVVRRVLSGRKARNDSDGAFD